MTEKSVKECADTLNSLFKQYLKIQRSMEAEKEAYLLEMEYTPLQDNPVLKSVLQAKQNDSSPIFTDPDPDAGPSGYPDSVYYPADLAPADYAVYQDLILNNTPLPSETRARQIKEEASECCAFLSEYLDIQSAVAKNSSRIEEQIKKKVERYFLTRKPENRRSLSSKNVDGMLSRYIAKDGTLSMNSLRKICFPSESAQDYLIGFINSTSDPVAGKIMMLLKKAKSIMGIKTQDRIKQDLSESRFAEAFLRDIRKQFTKEKILQLLSANPNYSRILRRYSDSGSQSRITQGLLNAIPETYPDLFPLARQMQRHFILHIGPTNSGKSYEALNALKEAGSGVYLAPLRLLAYEKFEELNEAGVLCSLKTGEEEIMVPGETVRSSTIEVLDFSRTYEVAVIDEAQMICDAQRGNAWTMALLGVQADTVHVCLAPEAEKVLIQMIRACDDTYEIVRHERLVPLYTREYSKPVFPQNAKQGDAFIVFSRRDVHAAASELQRNGFRCSVIYGNLPYDVRRGEVKRYVNKETDVVVATDAIGMGLNLPIKRIVFLEMTKFDGVNERLLLPSEIRQIAGRAGRYGIFPEGIVTADTDFPYMEASLHETPAPSGKARIGFPFSLIGIDGPISQLMDRWSHIRPKPGFEVADMSREIELARILENDTDDKELIYRFVMFPFDEQNENLKTIWYDLFRQELEGRSDHMKWLPEEPSRNSEDLKGLEEQFKICDMLYHYADTFSHRSRVQEILSRKSQISAAIMLILSREKLEKRTCRQCGKALPFRYPYGICRDCYILNKKTEHMKPGGYKNRRKKIRK